MADFTRFAKTRLSPLPAQIITTMILELCVTLFGILAASAAISVFPDEGRLLWTPFDILLAFQKRGGAKVRAATFFGGLALTIPQLGVNVMWNAYTSGIYYSTVFPKYFTIRRGGYLTTALAVALQPWIVAGKPSSYARALNGMSILVGSLTGI
jgi:NCS1 family nucleobase:cation symporter-1